ncbi:unnamed protein product, partial [Rotaria sp. Silwood1]
NLHHQLTSSPSVVHKNSAASPELLRDDYHQRPVACANSLTDSPSSSSSVKHRRSITTRPPQLTSLPKINHEEIEMIDKVDIDFADEDSPIVSGHK